VRDLRISAADQLNHPDLPPSSGRQPCDIDEEFLSTSRVALRQKVDPSSSPLFVHLRSLELPPLIPFHPCLDNFSSFSRFKTLFPPLCKGFPFLQTLGRGGFRKDYLLIFTIPHMRYKLIRLHPLTLLSGPRWWPLAPRCTSLPMYSDHLSFFPLGSSVANPAAQVNSLSPAHSPPLAFWSRDHSRTHPLSPPVFVLVFT